MCFSHCDADKNQTSIYIYLRFLILSFTLYKSRQHQNRLDPAHLFCHPRFGITDMDMIVLTYSRKQRHSQRHVAYLLVQAWHDVSNPVCYDAPHKCILATINSLKLLLSQSPKAR